MVVNKISISNFNPVSCGLVSSILIVGGRKWSRNGVLLIQVIANKVIKEYSETHEALLQTPYTLNFR